MRNKMLYFLAVFIACIAIHQTFFVSVEILGKLEDKFI